MKRENRYLVLKRRDIFQYLTAEQREQLMRICASINASRKSDSRDYLDCVVVEKDWPEYEPVWEMIEKRVAEELK